MSDSEDDSPRVPSVSASAGAELLYWRWNVDTLELTLANQAVRDAGAIVWESTNPSKFVWPNKKPGWKEDDELRAKHDDTPQYIALQIVCATGVSKTSSAVVHVPAQHEQLSSADLYWIRQRSQLLLSNLQKAMRRRQTQVVLRTAFLLMLQTDPTSVVAMLKRCIIIIAEDATLHPVIPYLVFFFLSVTYGFDLTALAKNVILQGLLNVCDDDVPADWRCAHELDRFIEERSDDERKDAANSQGNDDDGSDAVDPTPSEHMLLTALAVRASYGGMNGDMVMLHYLYKTWNKRFRVQRHKLPTCWRRWTTEKGGAWWSQPWPRELSYASGWTFTKSDQLKEAVDHHCSSILVQLMAEANVPTSEHVRLSSLIWERRSNLRNRVCTCDLHRDNELIDSNPVRSSDPAWWQVAWKNLDRLSLIEWHTPTPANTQESYGKKMSRQQLLERQMDELDAKQKGRTATAPGSSAKDMEKKKAQLCKRLKIEPAAFKSIDGFLKPREK